MVNSRKQLIPVNFSLTHFLWKEAYSLLPLTFGWVPQSECKVKDRSRGLRLTLKRWT